MHRFFCIVILFMLAGGNSPAERKESPSSEDITVSWSISVASRKGGDMGLAETYSGGVETLFATGGQARIRLVSLMRIQAYLCRQRGIRQKALSS